MIRTLIARIGAYADHPEPRCALAGKIALVVASNQPFYPLYLHAIAGTAAWPAWLTLLTTPFFLAVPALARRHSVAGRALLVVVGTLNTVLCAKLFGLDSGVELFLLPCVLLGTILFRPAERVATAPVALLPFIAYLAIDPHVGAPVMVTADQARIVALNAMSVAALIGLIGLLGSSMLAARDV